jgi:hypothetical protein
MIDVNGNRFMTHAEPIYVDGQRVNQVFVNGVLVYPCLPSKIEVVIPPAKTEYISGENIDFTGIVVRALNPDGSVWETPTYSGGVIPFNELVFPQNLAISMNAPSYASSDILSQYFGIDSIPVIGAG